MKTFIYTEEQSNERRFNKCITVYRVKNNVPEQVAEGHYASAAWKGASSEAHYLIASAVLNLKGFDGYKIKAPSIAVYALGSTWNEVR